MTPAVDKERQGVGNDCHGLGHGGPKFLHELSPTVALAYTRKKTSPGFGECPFRHADDSGQLRGGLCDFLGSPLEPAAGHFLGLVQGVARTSIDVH